MRKLVILTIAFIAALIVTPLQAQPTDDATCVSVVGAAFEATRTNCEGLEAGQLCYGSGVVEAVPRYLTADFAFDEAGDQLNLNQIETLGTQPLDTEAEQYGVARLHIGGENTLHLLMFGNTFAANNVIPALEVELTTATITTLQGRPAALSQQVGALVPGDLVTAVGRANPGGGLDVTDDTWVRVRSEVGTGWVRATAFEEDYLIPSLTLVSADEPTLPAMGSMSFIGGGNDRACSSVNDSGVLAQATSGQASLRINGVELTLAPTTTIYVEAQPNATMSVFVLEGEANALFDGAEQAIAAGEVVRVDVSVDGLATGDVSLPMPYASEKVRPLATANVALPRSIMIAPGTELADGLGDNPEIIQSDEVVETVSTAVPPPPEAATEDIAAEDVAAEIPANGTATSTFAETIRERGTVRIGVNGTLPLFSVEQDGAFSGFEVDLARAVAQRLFGEGVEVAFTRVSARQRPTVLGNGEADLMVRNSSFQPDRAEWGEWTNTFYFVDGQRMIVRTADGIESYSDLSGRTVAVQEATPTQDALEAAAEEFGFTVLPVRGVLPDVFAAFESGEADALSADWTVLEALRATAPDGATYQVIGEPLTEIPWNIVVPPGETDFLAEVDAALLSVISDGTWLELYNQNVDTPLPDSIGIIFTPAATVTSTVAVEEVPPVPTEETADAPPPAPDAEPEPSVTTPATPVQNTSNLPVTGEVPVTIFTPQNQQRTVIITPSGDSGFTLELQRGGEIVYSGDYAFYESAGRYENIRNSFEFVEFSDTAGDTSLGCDRPPDISGFFNGANFEGRVGC